MARKSRNRRSERFAQLPLDVLLNDNFRWVPDFGARVLLAVTAQYNGNNNGGLELTAADALRFGIREDELFAGIGLLLAAGFLRRTVAARRRSGKGQPARYALTWRPLNDFPRFGIVPTIAASRDWEKCAPPFPAVRSVRAAEIALGIRKARPSRLHTDAPRPISKRVPGTHPVKEPDMTRHAPGENATFTWNAPGEVPGTRPVTKNLVQLAAELSARRLKHEGSRAAVGAA